MRHSEGPAARRPGGGTDGPACLAHPLRRHDCVVLIKTTLAGDYQNEMIKLGQGADGRIGRTGGARSWRLGSVALALAVAPKRLIGPDLERRARQASHVNQTRAATGAGARLPLALR